MDKKQQKRTGENVRRYRLEKKLTQEALAELVDVNASAITRIESGERGVSVPTLIALAKALGVSCDALLCKEDAPSRHRANIHSVLSGQSEKSLAHLEKVLQVFIAKYGEKEEI